MTVGIVLTNGLEAVVITDKRSSHHQRQSDLTEKTCPFGGEKYHGVVFGSGSAYTVEGVATKQKVITVGTLIEYVEKIRQVIQLLEDEVDNSVLLGKAHEIDKKAIVFIDEKERESFKRSERERLLQYYEGSFKREMATNFALVAYDKETKRICLFSLENGTKFEVFFPYHVVGSGSDGAQFYFSMKLQGLDTKKLSFPDLLFLAINAYSFSTVNQGVGGMPRITLVDKTATTALPLEKTATLVNLSGAYLSEINPLLTTNCMYKFFRRVLSDDMPDYEKIGNVIGLNKEKLTAMAIPYGAWQESANLVRLLKK